MEGLLDKITTWAPNTHVSEPAMGSAINAAVDLFVRTIFHIEVFNERRMDIVGRSRWYCQHFRLGDPELLDFAILLRFVALIRNKLFSVQLMSILFLCLSKWRS